MPEASASPDDATRTDATQTDATQGDATQTDATQTDATQTDATRTDATRTDATQGDATQTDATQTDATQTDATQTDATQTDATQSHATPSHATPSHATRTDATRTDATQTDATQTDATQGDATGGPFVFGARSTAGRGRTIRIRLTDSPISRAGYWFGTAVGATWGFLLSTGRIERRQGMIVFRGMPKWAFGRGGACVGGTYLTDRNVNPRVLKHEAVHRAQWRKYGMLFPLLYLIAGRDPLRNRFEIEAGLEDGGYLPRRRPAGRPAGVAGEHA